MESNGKLEHDPQVEIVKERIEISRSNLSDTIEALVYKTDVPARTGDAIGAGLETAKNAVSETVENVQGAAAIAADIAAENAKSLAEQAKAVTEQAKVVASHATDAAAATAANVRASTVDAVESAVVAASFVPEPTRNTVRNVVIGVVALLAIVFFLRRRRPKPDEAFEIDGILEVDDLTIIDPADLDSPLSRG